MMLLWEKRVCNLNRKKENQDFFIFYPKLQQTVNKSNQIKKEGNLSLLKKVASSGYSSIPAPDIFLII